MPEPDADKVELEATVARMVAAIEALERRVERIEAQALADQLRAESDRAAD